MSVADWLRKSYYRGLKDADIPQIGRFVDDLAKLAAQQHEALVESNRWLLILANHIPDANTDIASGAVYQQNSKAIQAGEDFKKKHE